MKNNNFSTYVLAISIMTFFTLFTVVVAKSYDNLMSSINIAQSNPLGKPIDLDVKFDVIDLIELRK